MILLTHIGLLDRKTEAPEHPLALLHVDHPVLVVVKELQHVPHSLLSVITVYREQSLQVVVVVLLEAELVLVHPADQLNLLLLILHRLLDVRLLIAGPAGVGGAQEVAQQVTGGLLQLVLNILLVMRCYALTPLINLLCVLHVSSMNCA